MSHQTLLFTVIPRGVTIHQAGQGGTLPVSVVVSPRLSGARHLSAFPDWLAWTELLKENGLRLTFLCAGKKHTAQIDPAPLEPRLWRALFDDETLVRPFEFQDHSQTAVFSYSTRLALSALKTIYQTAGLALALPERSPVGDRQHSTHRAVLGTLLKGLEVNWDEKTGEQWRNRQRDTAFSSSKGAARFSAGILSPDGMIAPHVMPQPLANPAASEQFHAAVVQPFAVYHHMPQPAAATALKDEPPDMKTILDFHQALTSLNNYPELQLALGLVFEFDLPADFFAFTGAAAKTVSIVDVKPGWDWRVRTDTPPLETAYLNAATDNGAHGFFTAPLGVLQKSTPEVLGLLNLDPTHFGLAQVDVDGGMHKAIMLAETLTGAEQLPATHPEVFDPTATLPSLRSGGFSLFADARAQTLLERFHDSKAFNDSLVNNTAQPRPFYAEDLVRGYRLDVWDSQTKKWHSLHQRVANFRIGEGDGVETFTAEKSEGFVQLAATKAAANQHDPAPPQDLYLHEAVARWAGWSLAAPMPGKHMTRDGDPDKAVPPDDEAHPDFDPENPAVTPFKVATQFTPARGSLPSLRFGRQYRIRARVVDLAGKSMELEDKLAGLLAQAMALPAEAEGFPYLRYEPVPAPQVVIRDPLAVTSPGSAVDRLVIRTANSDASLDIAAADLTASDRHIVPPHCTIEIGERLGMFDDTHGKLIATPEMYALIQQRDEGALPVQAVPEIVIDGKVQEYPIVPEDRLEGADGRPAVPYLPDALSRGAAFRDLPGTLSGTLGKVRQLPDGTSELIYAPLADANPRPGSATIISFEGDRDWQDAKPFRLALADGIAAPVWDAENRALTVSLPKGTTCVIPLTSYLRAHDLKLMGVWQWLREYIDFVTIFGPGQQSFLPGLDVDLIAHILQRAVEGGHWMLTPPRLLTLVHAVQQPIGAPHWTRLTVQRARAASELIGEAERAPTQAVETATITAWRRPNSVEAYLLGGLLVHGASTDKVDIKATWDDPVDDGVSAKPGISHHAAQADEIPLPRPVAGYVYASGTPQRPVGWYDPQADLVALVREGDALGSLAEGKTIFQDAAPRHHFNDTKHHRVSYTAVATSRYREYFPQDAAGGFTRASEPVTVDVPASARPDAPRVLYVLPTFGWQRQTQTNLKRSVRFGGGLRIYLERPWFSSGADELLGVTLWNPASGAPSDAARAKWKPFVTQWGADPIWQTAGLYELPTVTHFPDTVAWELALSLQERTPDAADGKPGRVDVVGFPVQFDEERKLWFCDVTLNTLSPSYMPFVRLALVRYQPYALPDAKLSRVVLADFVQLTPDRSAIVTADPYHSRSLRVTVSGPAPQGPSPKVRGSSKTPHPATQVFVSLQQRIGSLSSDLAWEDAPDAATIHTDFAGAFPTNHDLQLWTGTVTFAEQPKSGHYRLVIREYEYITAGSQVAAPQSEGRHVALAPRGRLIYGETVEIDAALLAHPHQPAAGVHHEER